MVNENHIEVKAVMTLKYLSFAEYLRNYPYDIDKWFAGVIQEYITMRNGPFHLELLSTELDPSVVDGRREKPSLQARSYQYLGEDVDNQLERFGATFAVPAKFGKIGAVLVLNLHNAEIYLKNIVLDGLPDDGKISFSCRSWLQCGIDLPDKRIFFTNKSYLPCQTPEGLVERRRQELQNLRGNGDQGERKRFERIYDYDVYNDLGYPDSNDDELKRIVLGGKYPYPRRCRTGRPKSVNDPSSETRTNGSIYMPRDEQFSETKGSDFSINVLKAALQSLIPSLEAAMGDPNLGFRSFTDINELFSKGIHLQRLPEQESATFSFPPPDMFKRDTLGWLRDEEFARQTLAGTNPCAIQLVKVFWKHPLDLFGEWVLVLCGIYWKWPIMSKLDAKDYGPPESAITAELIQPLIGGSVGRAIDEKKLFMLDFHDLLMPFVNKVRDIPRSTLYASRTLFYLSAPEGMLKPLAIELSRPPKDDKPQWRRVYTPSLDGTELWLWRLAKAHVLSHDSAHHQLISHWLRAHCSTEPYIIAANRQLSAMHPIYRLLLPHFRYTMEMNALARESLINAGGVIESVFAARKYAMELSSCVYRDEWRFDLQGLPADLIFRGMAEESQSATHGLQLAIEDYPFANDGLLLWDAIKEWVTDYVNTYYASEAGGNSSTSSTRKRPRTEDNNVVRSDEELQRWWKEIQEVGHGDKYGKPGWPKLETRQDLIGILTTMIWVSSGHHSAVNFGQYAYSGYFPNRPTIARTKVPDENPSDEEWSLFLEKPENALLESFPSKLQATKEMAIVEVLSSHSPDEEYIGKTVEKSWEEDASVRKALKKFQGRLKEMEVEIDKRNVNDKNKNRFGAGIVPYQLLKPYSERGVTGMGIPNSVSI